MRLHSIDSLFRGTWKLYGERWAVLVEIVLLPALVTILGVVLVGLGSPFSTFGSLALFAGWVLFVFSSLPLVFSIQNGSGVDASYRATIGWFWSFVWLAILEILAVMGGMFMLIIPGIWLAIALSLMVYVFVIERRRGLDALRQSKDYMKGYWWAVAGRSILLGLLFIGATIVIEFPVALFFGKSAGSLASMVLVLFFMPYSAIYHYNIFTNLRELKPELGGAQTKDGTGFIKASAIVGLVAPILLIIATVMLIGFGIFHAASHMNSYAPVPIEYGGQIPPQQ